MNQRPVFSYFDNPRIGKCMYYPVSIHIDGRQWGEKFIVVSLKAWDEGVRKFGFFDGAGVTYPEYVPSAKVERSIAKAVADAKEYFAKMDKIRQLQEELRNTKDELRDMLNDYEFSLTPFL